MLNNKVMLLFAIILASFYPKVDSTLEMVSVLFRHGDRTPITHFKTDPYANQSYWSEKPGQLTKEGKIMEYNLGKWLRNRYPDIVSQKFDPDEISVISTDFDRTLMSAQCVVAAFFYPKNVSIRFSKDLAWMPTPIHTAPLGSDLLLNVDSSCPRISVEFEKLISSTKVQNWLINYKTEFDFVSNHSGQTVNSFMDVDFIYDTLFIEKLHNMTLPEWSMEKFEIMKEMSTISFNLIAMSKELKRLRGGPLLGKITKDMNHRVINSSDAKVKKMYMYSAHDSTIATLLNTMEVFDPQAPPYASTVIWELHHEEDKGHFVRLFYQNDTTMVNAPHRLVIPGCTEDCPFDKWYSLLKPVIPDDWNSECYRPDPLRYQHIIIGLSVTALALIAAVIGVIFLLKRKSTRENNYQVLPGDTEES